MFSNVLPLSKNVEYFSSDHLNSDFIFRPKIKKDEKKEFTQKSDIISNQNTENQNHITEINIPFGDIKIMTGQKVIPFTKMNLNGSVISQRNVNLPVTLKPVITAKNSQSNDKKTIKALGIGFHLPDIIESNETNFHSHQRPQNFNDIRKKIKPAPIPIFNIEIPSKIKSVSITLDSRPKNTSNPDYEYKQFNTTSNLSLLAAIKSITEKYRETYRIE